MRLLSQHLARFGALVTITGFMAMAFGTPALAQDSTANSSSPTVSVQGEGVVRVAPDAASTTIGVTVSDPTLANAQAAATELITAVTDAIKADGVDASDIQTSNFSVTPIQNFDENGNPTDITQFQVSNQLSVVIRDLSMVGTVLDDAVAAGANSIWGINFIVTDSAEAVSEARAAAVADAQDRAEQLAVAAGLSLGDVVSISEIASPSVYPAGKGGGFAADSAAVPIESGTNEVRVSVQVVYELV